MMRIAIRGFERDGNYGIFRFALAEEGEECLEVLKFNDCKPKLKLPLSVDLPEGFTFEVVDEHADDDTGEWVIRFKLSRKR